MEVTDRFIISPAGALWFGNIAGRGGGTGLIKVVNLFLRWILFRSKYCFLLNMTFIYLRQEWRPVNIRRFICGWRGDPQIVPYNILSGWYTQPYSHLVVLKCFSCSSKQYL